MLPCFTHDVGPARPIHVVPSASFGTWRDSQPKRVQQWLEGTGFEPKGGRCTLLPGESGTPAGALLVPSDPLEPWDTAGLVKGLPEGDWQLDPIGFELEPGLAALGFALATYRFDRYRQVPARAVRLALPDQPAVRRANRIAEAVFLARDLINTPASDLGPEELETAVREVAERAGAAVHAVVGDALLEQNYPTVHAVGRASPRAPRVIDLTFGDPDAPRVTLVGKGVCFDSGGLDLKTASGMLLMKKDMGGAAIMLALAQAIMAAALPVRLRLLIGAVENSVSGASFRPGDILRTRKGLTVEVGNTDAEGRLVLADLLAEADGEDPSLLIDAATLTGAARVALGPDLPALFTDDEALARDLETAGADAFDPLWRLPLHAPYLRMIETPIADLNNAGTGGFAGAITAALFLQAFISPGRAWAHLDLYAWSQEERPGRPKGGEASALRALYTLIERRYG